MQAKGQNWVEVSPGAYGSVGSCSVGARSGLGTDKAEVAGTRLGQGWGRNQAEGSLEA